MKTKNQITIFKFFQSQNSYEQAESRKLLTQNIFQHYVLRYVSKSIKKPLGKAKQQFH